MGLPFDNNAEAGPSKPSISPRHTERTYTSTSTIARQSIKVDSTHPLSPSSHTAHGQNRPQRMSISYSGSGSSARSTSRTPTSGDVNGYFDTAAMPTKTELEPDTPSHVHEPTGTGHIPSPKRAAFSSEADYLDSMTNEEMEVVRTRFDLMDDQELANYMDNLQRRGQKEDTPASGETRGDSDRPHTPLFPPSPPSEPSPLLGQLHRPTQNSTGNHPLQVLARAVMELQETVDKFRLENETLREELASATGSVTGRIGREGQSSHSGKGKSQKKGGSSHDKVSLYDGLTEAISTSLTSPSILAVDLPSRTPIIEPHHTRIPSPAPSYRSSRSHGLHVPNGIASDPLLPGPSNRSVRSVEARSEVINPSKRSVRSFDAGSAISDTPAGTRAAAEVPASHRKRDSPARASWTASLWGWGGGSSSSGGIGASSSANKRAGKTRNRTGSLASSLRSQVVPPEESETAVDDEEDEEVWGRGDGGSPPAFRAIFLATRLLTPDPLSVLSSSHISADSLVARLAYALVTTARDEEITARDPPGRRRSSRETRSTSASILSHDSQKLSTGGDDSGGDTIKGKERGYGDTLITAGTYGRSLLSSVSGATLRPTRSKGSESVSGQAGDAESIRPSLLSKSSSRSFPTSAVLSTAAPDISIARLKTDSLSIPSVEMASIIPDENQPPTVLLSRQNLGLFFQSTKSGRVQTASRFNKGSDPPLTDRYGFIYDIQHASMLKDASEAGAPAPASLSGVIPGQPAAILAEDGEGWIDKRRRASQEVRPSPSRRSTASIEALLSAATASTSASGGSSPAFGPVRDIPSDNTSVNDTSKKTNLRQARSRVDADVHRHRSSTLVSLNPSPARPVTPARDTLTVSARGASSLHSAANSPLLDLPPSLPDPASLDHTTPLDPSISRTTVSSLLDQLTELHDRQQAERKVEWDAWLRKRKNHSSKVDVGSNGWSTDFLGVSQMGLGNGKNAEEWRAFAKLVRRGIPLAYRADVWAECSGARDALVPGEYKEVLDVHSQDTSPVLRDIEKDVSRTFPGNMFFGGDGPGVAKLRRVLVAYSWRNPAVGYCQGMNMLAATLLLTHTDEEQAFWVLAAIIDRLLPGDFYSPSLLASRTDQAVLGELVAMHLPKISTHLADLGVDLASITFGWFLSLFTDCLPVETLFRVWDVFFVEGHDTLFRVALAILKLNETDLCATEDASDLFIYVGGMTSRLWAADKLIALQHSFKPIVRHSDISGRYAKHLAELQDV